MYFARMVTLTSANTNYTLRTLLSGVTHLPLTVASVTLQVPETNTNDVARGDSSMSSMTTGKTLHPGDSETIEPAEGVLDLGRMTVRSDGAGQKLFVEGWTR